MGKSGSTSGLEFGEEGIDGGGLAIILGFHFCINFIFVKHIKERIFRITSKCSKTKKRLY